jgi:transposase
MHRHLPQERFAVVWDGASIHRSKEIKDLLRRKPSVFHLEQLPGYSPELNPIELLWAYLKHVKLKNHLFFNLEELETALVKALNEIASDPELIRSFFTKSSVGNIL